MEPNDFILYILLFRNEFILLICCSNSIGVIEKHKLNYYLIETIEFNRINSNLRCKPLLLKT